MPPEKTTQTFGRHIYGLGVMAIAIATLAFKTFDPGQPVPDHFPARAALAIAAGIFMVLTAAAIQSRRTAPHAEAGLGRRRSARTASDLTTFVMANGDSPSRSENAVPKHEAAAEIRKGKGDGDNQC